MDLYLPWPPSANRYWRHWRGRMVVSQAARAYKAAAATQAWSDGLRMIPDGPVSVTAVLHPPDRRRRDLDNCLKVLLDALEGVGYADDHQVRELMASFGAVCSGGAAGVRVIPMEGDECTTTD